MKKKEWKKLCKEREAELGYWSATCSKERAICFDLRVQHIEDSNTIEELRDAAEFEARVAEWLTHDEVEDYTRDPCSGCQFAYDDLVDCPYEREWCRLKMARLAVEEEMDNEG